MNISVLTYSFRLFHKFLWLCPFQQQYSNIFAFPFERILLVSLNKFQTATPKIHHKKLALKFHCKRPKYTIHNQPLSCNHYAEPILLENIRHLGSCEKQMKKSKSPFYERDVYICKGNLHLEVFPLLVLQKEG